MPYYLADSFGGLGQQAIADEQNRRIGLANAMSAMQSGMASLKQSKQFQQQMGLEKQRAEAEAGYRTGELGMRQAEIERQLEMDRQRNELGKGYLKVQQDMLDYQKTQPNANQQRRIDFDFNAAAGDASQGRFDNPDHVLSLYPTLTEPEANVMASRSIDARRNIQTEHDVASHAADTLNKWNFLNKQLATAKTGVQTAHSVLPWQTGAEKNAATDLKSVQDQLGQIGPIAAHIQSDKRISGLVTYDPDSDSYVPAVPSYPWMQGNATGTRQAPVAGPGPTSGTATAPPAQPTARPMRPAPVPGAMQPQAGTSTGTSGAGARQHSPAVYNRVNQLLQQNPGMDPVTAKRQALLEDSGF